MTPQLILAPSLESFALALTSESNWLRGGKVLASHTSEDNGVVTSLAMDNNYLIIGMANSHIHVFDAITGAFRKSLTGHTGGVWTLVMVSGCTGAGAAPSLPTSSGTRSSSSASGTPGNGASGRGKFGMPGRRASFAAAAAGLIGATTRSAASSSAGAGTQTGAGGTNATNATTARTVLNFMGQEEVQDPGPRPPRSAPSQAGDEDDEIEFDDIEDLGPQSDVCNAAKGFGNERAVVVSGGCDRMVKVWDIQTG